MCASISSLPKCKLWVAHSRYVALEFLGNPGFFGTQQNFIWHNLPMLSNHWNGFHAPTADVGTFNNNDIFAGWLNCCSVNTDASPLSLSDHEFAVKVILAKSPTLQRHAWVNNTFPRQKIDTFSRSAVCSHHVPNILLIVAELRDLALPHL